MQAGHSAAWEGRWAEALKAYQAAVTEFPDDGGALNALGMAYLEQNQLKEALTVYQRAAAKTPGDPVAPEKCGEILGRLGRNREAGQAFLYVAELHLKRQDVAKAVTNLARSVKATPDNLGARSRLALALERAGKPQAAALEFIQVARLFQQAADPAKANAALQRAVQLSQQLPEAREAFSCLKNAQLIPSSLRGVEIALEAPASNPTPQTPNPLGVFAEASASAQPVRKANVLEQAREVALTLLAELLFDEDADTTKTAGSVSALSRGTGALRNPQGQRAHAIMYLGQAINEQSLGSREAALNLYTNVMNAGLDHPLVHFMRGVLLLELRRPQEALAALTPALQHQAVVTGANYGLGEAARQLGQARHAFHYFFDALKQLDVSLAPADQQDAIAEGYDTLSESFSRLTDDELGRMLPSVQHMLSGDNWEERARSARQQLDRDGGGGTLADLLATPGNDAAMESLRKIEEHMRRGLYATAMEEAYYALDASPTYLPVHIRMAEILTAENRPDAAAQKYQVVAATYKARGEVGRSIRLLNRVLNLNPLDVTARTELIELLKSQGQMTDAISHIAELGRTYYELADLEGAREQYARALELAQKSGDRTWSVKILHELGDIDVQRLAWRDALKVYEQVKTLAPGDERARIALIDLYFRIDNQRSGVAELDEQLKHLITHRQFSNATILLEELANSYPGHGAIIARLARVYQDQGRKADAINRYEGLIELQIQSGAQAQARETIQAVLALSPEDPAPFVRLLGQLN